MAANIALVLSGHGANDAIRGQMTEYGNALSEIGVSVVHVVATDISEMQHAAELIVSGRVGFGFTWLGIGQDLSAKVGNESAASNLWNKFGVPLLKIQGDLPAYFTQLHRDTPTTTVNLYASPEYIHFRKRWLPDARALTALMPPMPLTPIERRQITLSSRRAGRLVFLKNGNDPSQLRKMWDECLPPSVAKFLSAASDEIASIGTQAGPLHIGDFVAERLAHVGIDPDSTPYLVRFISAQLDDLLRRIKSRMIAEALLDFPVIIQGAHWEHLDFSGRRAQLVPGQDYDRTREIYSSQLGIIDMSPNVDLSPHERVQRSAGSFAMVLTNRQTWLDRQFSEFESMTFEFTPDSIKDRVANVIANPDRNLDLAVAFGERFRQVYPRQSFANRVADVAEFAALQWSPAKPPLQPFYIWPSPWLDMAPPRHLE